MNIAYQLWALDPGYFKLKNVVYTVISLVIVVWLA